MPAATSSHIYLRDVDDTRRNSLSVLASMIPPGCRVLDVGTGSGALGKYLSGRMDCETDGITNNPGEQALAAPYYRRLELLDLETGALREVLRGEKYDRVVCADVLEHLRSPEKILDTVRHLLDEGGRLLLSIPNVAYFGLIAELLDGSFRYRREGLLDRTHLRFFTRKSLLDFLGSRRWQVTRIESIKVELRESEFRTSPQSLPPAVLHRLLDLPDSLTYQFVLEAKPLSSGEQPDHDAFLETQPTPLLDHMAALYWNDGSGYTETQRVVAWGTVGVEDQCLLFRLPDAPNVVGLRLDPADRPGFIRLRSLRLLSPAQEVLWCWDGQVDSLAHQAHQQMAFGSMTDTGLAILLKGDDAFLELPVPESTLLSVPSGSCLEARMSWPLSSDFLALAENLRSREDAITAGLAREANLQAENAALLASRLEVESRLHDTESRLRVLEDRLHQADEEQHELAESLADSRRQTAWVAGEREELRLHLQSIEQSTLFRATRPLVAAKAAIDRWLANLPGPSVIESQAAGQLPPPADSAMVPPNSPVDIVVPVYRGLEDTRCCLESVLRCQVATSYRLIVIFDAGPDSEVLDYLRDLVVRTPAVLLLENDHNLGFVATVNRGMLQDDARDVVLLNSDAEVANDWLDRLRCAAYSGQRIGSVTPLSNNATICSYPRSCQSNELPKGFDTGRLDRLCAQVNLGQRVAIPTGVGFCMYIRRDCLAEIGPFDVENFGKGYGEENDFCMRALGSGWTHLLALDTFVRHAGGVSFGESKKPRELEAFEKLRRLHPRYELLVREHIASDPARPARLAIDSARIQAASLPTVLFVTHSRGGGTERHVRELADRIRTSANALVLRPATGGITTIEWLSAGEEDFRLSFRLPEDIEALSEVLTALGVVHIHFHHLLGIAPEVWGLPERLGVCFDYTAHDHYAICPQISLTGLDNRYCGEKGRDQCTACLQRSPASHGVGIIEWRRNYRQLLRQARHVFAPSHDTAGHLRKQFPEIEVLVVEHPDLQDISLPDPVARPMTGSRPLRIAIIGALSTIKGADLLEEVALESARREVPLEFHLVGFGYRSLATQPKAALTVHGAYQEDDLGALLDWLQPDVVWFPALWPETYSYTLSACLKAGLPVVAPDIGAFPERLAGRSWSWIEPWEQTAIEWLGFFLNIRSENFAQSIPPPVLPARSAENPPYCYRSDYLAGLTPRSERKELSAAQLRLCAYDRLNGVRAAQALVKRRALAMLARLRNIPLLSAVARHIPARWQSQLKTWLAG